MPRRRSKETLAEFGIKLILLGGALLFVPMLVGSHPVFGGFKTVLRFPGGVLLSVGLLVMALHLWRRKHDTAQATPAPKAPTRAAPGRNIPAKYDRAAARRILKADDRVEPTLATTAPNANPPATAPAHERLTRWSPEVFAAIEWRRFEAVVEALFAQAGFETRAQSHGADGGVDIWLHSRHSPEPRLVQCKHWKTEQVGVAQMREFLGVMTHHKLRHGTYATSSSFTPEAAAFAKANSISALDGAALLRLIATRTPEQQAALLTTAFEGEYWRPTCPSCGVKMVEPRGQKFWGCPNFRARGCTSKIYKSAA